MSYNSRVHIIFDFKSKKPQNFAKVMFDKKKDYYQGNILLYCIDITSITIIYCATNNNCRRKITDNRFIKYPVAIILNTVVIILIKLKRRLK